MRIRRAAAAPAGSRTSFDLRLIVACPGCQAPMTLEEGATAVACPGCNKQFLSLPRTHPLEVVVAPILDTGDALHRARSFLRAGKHRATWVARGRWRLLPYWRYRTKAFQWVEGLRHGPRDSAASFHDLEVRNFDLLIPATEAASNDLLPRPGIFTAYPLAPEVIAGASPTPVTLPFSVAQVRARSEVEVRTDLGGPRIVHRHLALVGEQMLLVHLPFFSLSYHFHDERHEVLVDGILGEVTTHRVPPGEPEPVATEPPGPSPKPLFLPLLCPACAESLRLSSDDLIHPCLCCGRAWEVTEQGLEEVSHRLAVTGGTGPDARYLPFWVIGVQVAGFFPLEQAARSDHSEKRLAVYVPAFESWQIDKLSHLGVRLTRSLPDYDTEEPGGSARTAGESHDELTLGGATLGRADAERFAWVILGALASANANTFSQFMKQGSMSTENAELHWLPFRPSGLYLHDPVSGAMVRNMPSPGEPPTDPPSTTSDRAPRRAA